jgi:hypothetical protein
LEGYLNPVAIQPSTIDARYPVEIGDTFLSEETSHYVSDDSTDCMGCKYLDAGDQKKIETT